MQIVKRLKNTPHKATLKEIEENDFNLNIPCYVDTLKKKNQLI